MALSENVEKHIQNRELYKALLSGNGNRVIELCKQVPKGPFHELTIHHDTVLHVATYSKQQELVLNLLRDLPENTDSTKMMLTVKNDSGNTILHEAATSNMLIPAAIEMSRRAPKLLLERNKFGETALGRAARYGKMEMFKFLDGEVKKMLASGGGGGEEERIVFYQTDDKATILHTAVLTDHFDLALHIAKEHEYLVNVKDGDGMTALQILACNPPAFENGFSIDEALVTEEVESCFKVPLWQSIHGKNKRYKLAVDLAKFLIAKDTSWEATGPVLNPRTLKTHNYGLTSASSQIQTVEEVQRTSSNPITGKVNTAETPLFLATKHGILEIVEGILDEYPQAVEHIDEHGCNILHVAIQYSQIHILYFVMSKMQVRRLMRKLNKDGNSLLHMVGKNQDDQAAKDMRNPAFQLQQELLLFEFVKKISTNHIPRHFNKDRKTAEMLFAESNSKLRNEAKEWLKRTTENCSIVTVLIATVAFPAAYTVPGGPNQNTGYPLLLHQPFFVMFTLTDVLSLTFALTSVITFLSILTSSFQLNDFKQSLPHKLMLGITLLILSVSMMMLAFAATVILLISNRKEWTKIVLYSVAFFPASILVLTYFPLYIELMKTFTYTLKKIGEAFPRFNGVFLRSLVAKSLRPGRTSNPTDQSLASARSLASSSAPQTTHDHPV